MCQNDPPKTGLHPKSYLNRLEGQRIEFGGDVSKWTLVEAVSNIEEGKALSE